MPIFQNNSLDQLFVYDSMMQFNRVHSFGRGTMIEPDALAAGLNIDIDQGTARTRRGIEALGAGTGAGSRVQGLGYLDVAAPSVLQRLLAIAGTAPYMWDGSSWTSAGSGYTVPTSDQRVSIAALVDLLFLSTGDMNLWKWDGSTFTEIGPGPLLTTASIVGTGTTATVVLTAHGRSTGDWVLLSGATPTGFNGTWQITVIDANTFTFASTVSATATVQATVTRGYCPRQYTILCTHTYRLFGAGIEDLPDTLDVSDILDGTVWDTFQNSARIGGGDSDPITGLCSWSNYNLVIGKRNSIWMMTCDPTQQPNNWNAQLVTGSAGCMAPRTMCQVGEDVFWLSKEGVRSLQYTLQGLTQGVSEPISRQIQDAIDTINWGSIDKASAIYWNKRYILSVPTGSNTECDTVLVYNTVTQGWCGLWEGWNATDFMGIFFNQLPRLAMGRADGTVAQWMDYVPDGEEAADNYLDMGNAYASSALTRAMTCNEPISPKKGFSAEVEFWDSLATDATVNTRLDGGGFNLFWEGSTLAPSGSLVGDALDWTLGQQTYWRIARDLQRCGSWRELQLEIATPAGKLNVRSVYVAARMEKFEGEVN